MLYRAVRWEISRMIPIGSVTKLMLGSLTHF